MGTDSTISAQRIWKPPDQRILKVNIDITCVGKKIGIRILIPNHLGISFSANAIPKSGRFLVDYDELKGIIE